MLHCIYHYLAFYIRCYIEIDCTTGLSSQNILSLEYSVNGANFVSGKIYKLNILYIIIRLYLTTITILENYKIKQLQVNEFFHVCFFTQKSKIYISFQSYISNPSYAIYLLNV